MSNCRFLGPHEHAIGGLAARLSNGEQFPGRPLVHVDLAEVEWSGAVEHIKATIGEIPRHVLQGAGSRGRGGIGSTHAGSQFVAVRLADDRIINLEDELTN